MEVQGKNSARHDLLQFYHFFHPYRYRAVLAVILTVALGSFDATIAWLLRPYMDNVIIGGAEHASGASAEGTAEGIVSGALFPIVIIVFVVTQGLFNYGSNYLMTWVGRRAGNDVKLALFNRLIRSDAAFFDRTTTGDILIHYNSDPETATGALLNDCRLFVTRIVSSIALVCVMLYNSWILTIVAVGALLIAIVPATRVRRRLKDHINDMVKRSGEITSSYTEAFSGNRVISSYGLQDYSNRRMKQTLANIFRLHIKVVQRSNWLTLVMHFATGLGIAATVWLQAYLIQTGRMTPGNLVSFMTALLMLYTPIKRLGPNLSSVQASTMAIGRIMSRLEKEPDIRSKPDAKPFPGLHNEIAFSHVTFAYEKGKDVLRDVSLSIHAGESVAFVGNSGGGKSTLVNLLPRFYDANAGEVSIDGVDVRDIDLDDLRRNISIVFQDSFLFSGTIRENIMLGRDGAGEDDVAAALRAACLDEFVGGLAKGLDTEIGERGVMLSGGQRQRMAIARAFIKNAPIVILDEATSALDTKSETVVQEAIENLMRNRTVLTIAHRLSTVINADRIVAIRDGQIVETGTHAELMAKEGGYYASLYRMQASS